MLSCYVLHVRAAAPGVVLLSLARWRLLLGGPEKRHGSSLVVLGSGTTRIAALRRSRQAAEGCSCDAAAQMEAARRRVHLINQRLFASPWPKARHTRMPSSRMLREGGPGRRSSWALDE